MADPRITYNSVNIDLKQGASGLKVMPSQERNENRSGSGKIETINLHGILEFSFEAYFSQAVYYTLWSWWSWARQGKAWSFALDSGKVGNTTLDAGAAAAQKTVPLTATAAFASGDVCFIKTSDADDEFEIVTIDTISAGVSIDTVSNLVYTYAAADIFRHKDYFPSVLTTDKKFDPQLTGVKNAAQKYYRHTFNFIEAL